MMQLYYAPDTISVTAAIALQETGLEHELIFVDVTTGAQRSPEYLALNPKGRVPALNTQGHILTETGAILEYLANRVPERQLMPEDLLQITRMRSVMYYLASTMHVNHAHKKRGLRWADSPECIAEMKAKVPRTMTESAQFIETECLAGPYLLGARFCMADIYLFNILCWLEGDGVNLVPFPKIRSHMMAMENRASVQKIRELEILT